MMQEVLMCVFLTFCVGSVHACLGIRVISSRLNYMYMTNRLWMGRGFTYRDFSGGTSSESIEED
jgi:hypothetical protein